MRAITILAITLLSSTQVLAGQACNTDKLGEEDLAIMASVLPAPVDGSATLLAQAGHAQVLYSVPDAYGRLGEEELSQIRSVQSPGEKIIVCTTSLPRPH